MITLTKLNGSQLHINPDQIESIEETPDTHIVLMNGNRFLVLEKIDAIVEQIISFHARIIHRAGYCSRHKYLKKRRAIVSKPFCPITKK